MSWATRFRIRQYLRSSLWVLPLLGALLGVALGAVDTHIDRSIHLPAAWTYSSTTATAVLSAIVGAMAALTGFVVTVTVLVVQMATGTFSARYMRLWYRDPMLKALLAVLVCTLAFSFALLRRVESNFVPNLGVSIAGSLVIVSLMVFMVFLDRNLHRLRPVAVAALAAGYVHREFGRLAADVTDAPDLYGGVLEPNDEQPSLVVRSPTAGAIQAVDLEGLIRWAVRHDRLVVLHHKVGDFVPAGATLFQVYGGGEAGGARDQRTLGGMVALGTERTIDQDPAFALRVIVDIADKALSAAINDPTTAVQVLDQLSEVLRLIGAIKGTDLRWQDGERPRRGVVLPVRHWEDYLTLGVTEIREYGSSSIQVMRRMRAMLEQLRDDVRPEHRPAVEEELRRLAATVAHTFADSVDLDRAGTADVEGIGGTDGNSSRGARAGSERQRTAREAPSR
jgi:uncharacterized membrane protein